MAAIVTGDRYLDKLVKFIDTNSSQLLDGTLVLKLNPVGLQYIQTRLESLRELEGLIAGAPVDYLRAYISDLGDHRALDKLGRILGLLTCLKVVAVGFRGVGRDPVPVWLVGFRRLKVLELRGCDLSSSAARGLLELRCCLEKLVCHNSTDALRHVFASRIVDIKDSSQWNRLSFVSCACNGLALMDESLQLLPVVDTLDLSRNKFNKVDNLHKCSKLKHLDLGFNHLRSIKSFRELSRHIVKLVLRNNALTTLQGIENLKSLESLDVSYNIISNLSELEFLSGISSLQSLWLEGNPLCCSRLYRAHVYSIFVHPEKLKLDAKEMSASDYWIRRIILAHRKKKTANFGFYSPAKAEAEVEACVNRKTKKASRVATIESEEESTYVCSDQDSISCDNEILIKEENAISDDESEIEDLMNRVERLKKERSVLWLRELKDWMIHENGDLNLMELKYKQMSFHSGKENYTTNHRGQKHTGECSRYISDSFQAPGDENSTNLVDPENSFPNMPASVHSQYCDQMGSSYQTSMGRMDLRHRSLLHESFTNVLIQTNGISNNNSASPSTTMDFTESDSVLACPCSPPHYNEDILHKRHSMVEEILQLSAESNHAASSESDSSSNEDDSIRCASSLSEGDQPAVEDYTD